MHTEQMKELIDRLAGGLSEEGGVKLVFGETRTVGDKSIIPVAKIGYGFGGGSGVGKAKVQLPERAEEVQKEGEESGKGAGFGGGLNVKPIGYIVITPEGVCFHPVFDLPALLMGAAAVMGVFFFKKLVFGMCSVGKSRGHCRS